MQSTAPSLGVEGVVRTLRIIVPSMAGGVLIFLALVVFVFNPGANRAAEGGAEAGGAAENALPILTYLAVAGLVGAVVARFVVVPVIVNANRQQLAQDVDKQKKDPGGVERTLAGTFQTVTIIGVALLEGAAFLAVIAYMIERSPIALGVALVLAAGILAHIPSVGRARSWVDQQTRRLEEERALGRSA